MSPLAWVFAGIWEALLMWHLLYATLVLIGPDRGPVRALRRYLIWVERWIAPVPVLISDGLSIRHHHLLGPVGLLWDLGIIYYAWHDDDDDVWKKKRRHLAARIKQIGRKLVVVIPTPAPSPLPV